MDKEPLDRTEVYDSQDEVPATRFPEWSVMRLVAVMAAVIMLLIGLVWAAELLGLLALVIPGGVSLFEGAIWGFIGLLGLALLVYLVVMERD